MTRTTPHRDGGRARPRPPATGRYRLLDQVLVRAPLLPAETYFALGRDAPAGGARGDGGAEPDGHGSRPDAERLMPGDPRIRRALAVGSHDLYEALRRSEGDGADSSALRGKLLRYLIRMSTRPTPYGLFAGVALARWGPGTDLALSGEAPATQTRPDMEWLLRLVFELEARPEIRRHLRFRTHSEAFCHAGRVFLPERAPGPGTDGAGAGVSIRAGQAVRRAIALARTPIGYQDLVTELLHTPGATPEKAAHLVDQLWEQTILLTDLRPPLTVASPTRYVLDRLGAIPAARQECAVLRRVLDAMERWDGLAVARGPEAYRELLTLAGSANAGSARHAVQVDMALPLAGREINRAVGEEAVRAAELLLAISPWPTGPPHLEAYRQAFEHRYGEDREVPLPELLDPDLGLGPPALYGQGAAPAGVDADALARRQRTLRDLALEAVRDHRRTVRLSDDTVARLRTCPPERATLPPSLDLALFVSAESAAALDAGEFRIVVGPNLGAPAAGRNLGRFAPLLGPEAEQVLRQVAAAEHGGAPHCLWAEVSYLPQELRTANVVVRPLVRDHEIVVGATAGGPAERVIPASELTVVLRDGRLGIRWPAAGTELRGCAGHMLNSFRAPAVCRFLDELPQSGVAQFSGFDWGPAADFPFLPRVEYGRIVLSPAQWRLEGALPGGTPEDDARAVGDWRRTWRVPRYVYLTEGDNRLLLDLADETQAGQLRTACERGPGALLQEALPFPGQAWTRGPEGHHTIELVVPMALRPGAADREPPAAAAPPAQASPGSAVTAVERMRPPGSDWLFAKLYCPKTFADDLITGHVARFCQFVCGSGLAEDWFFVRYADPAFHVRLRFRGDAGRLTHELAPQLFSWASGLMADDTCTRVCLDTYERELERYGGLQGMAAAERLFCADSRATAGLLRVWHGARSEIDPTLLAVLNTDDLLAGLGMGEAQRLRWYGANVRPSRQTGVEYRRRKDDLRNLLAHPGHPPPEAGGGAVADALSSRRRELAALFGDPAAPGAHGHPPGGGDESDLWRRAASFVHLSCNRLMGPDWPPEGHVLGLLLRTRTALDRSPVRQPAASPEPAAGLR